MDQTAIRLTTLSHGGGCGCKISPEVLSEMLSALPAKTLDPALMLGIGTNDDAAVYRLNDRQAVVATTDFFMPIVDDPFDFGRIAATNALSDVYAVGGRPIFALAIVGMPVDKLPVETIRQIMAGGAAVCEQAGIAIAGGHSIDAPEPIYGLVALGVVDPERVKRNDTAQAGDALVLGKSLGVGILSAAMKKGELSGPHYQEMVGVTTRLNSVGADLAEIPGLHAMTDVTGFALLGHLLEMCRGVNLTATVEMDALPILPAARELAQAGYNTGAAGRNWASYGAEVSLPEALPDWQKNLLLDPQTSGGLLVACDPAEVDRVLNLFREKGHADAAVIGAMAEGEGRITVR
jgi:selenide,water dikinase